MCVRKGNHLYVFLLYYISIIMKHTITNQQTREAKAPSPESQKASILTILRMVMSTKMIHPPLLMRATSFKWKRSCVNLFVIIPPSALHLWKCVMENQIVLMARMRKAATLTASIQVSHIAICSCWLLCVGPIVKLLLGQRYQHITIHLLGSCQIF